VRGGHLKKIQEFGPSQRIVLPKRKLIRRTQKREKRIFGKNPKTHGAPYLGDPGAKENSQSERSTEKKN